MNQYGNYGPRRSEMRKKQKLNTWLNGAIIISIIGIVFFASTLIFGGGSSEPAAGDELEEEQNALEEDVSVEDEEGLEETVGTEESTDDSTEEDSEGSNETETDNTSSSEEANGNESEETTPSTVVGEGQWAPIGTVQEEPFVAVYEKDHVNWEEMTRALKYATGLGDDMITWHIGNGGDHESAVGIVSDYANRKTPYEVRIEWVTNEGWMPVSVNQLEENPRLNNN
ncbi:hypothetical protein J2S74_001667 [Evansella vedderi]|uniref:DUF1510 domain-containing protein n=1 Tax=Evansella vedderi TaxID=38282 RepID=A0ABT9ZU91_9BACI|nr:YrrS family protein [Evansella vedderi]MDQ0254292.1 hypothetical protein [Evansella vedderi]